MDIQQFVEAMKVEANDPILDVAQQLQVRVGTLTSSEVVCEINELNEALRCGTRAGWC